MTVGESIVINLAERYASAFGIVAVNNAINTAVATREPNGYNIEVYEDLDTVFEDTEFIYEEFRQNQAQPIEKSLKFGSMLESDGNGSIYAPPLMINFSREKNLIETPISGGDGVVIEKWGTKPWNIDIRGILIDFENRNYPTEKIQELTKLFEYNNVIRVIGTQFLEKDIDSIYIRDISITPIEGFQDTIQFTLSASSIRAVSWTLLEPNK
ncbi:DUF6046 domain-containing protein [Chryseobacterium scophthalmum]|uniref:DUF6046 domain-containing protein n=1 Tax=Chryseobacterium scophthalmum TaxID=59733 RepID=UPI000C9E46B9|nr:DUF6046 domain-containing protein [Chryseobacterium scophthalmum]